jgi:hypothetical protein
MMNNKEVKTGPQEGSFTTGGQGFENFNDRIQTQVEISDMMTACFCDKTRLNLEEFQSINENKSSDMLITILSLLKRSLPCSE